MAMIRFSKDNGKITLGGEGHSLPKKVSAEKPNSQKSAFELVQNRQTLGSLGTIDRDPAHDPLLTDFLDTIISNKS